MRHYDYGINIDKLRVCLNVPDGLYEHLKDHSSYLDEQKHRIYDDGEFYLRFIDEDEHNMTALVHIRDTDGDQLLGTFEFHNTSKYIGKTFFTFENKVLYKSLIKLNDGEQHNYICIALYIFDYLGLTFNNITELELALDTPFNYIRKIRSLIKNVKKYDLILNGRKVKDNEEILNGYGEYYTRSRVELSKYPTIYHSHAKATDLSMKVYDKTREMVESTPHKLSYLPEWLGWDNTEQIYRVEVRLHNTNVRDFCNRYAKNLYPDSGEHSNVLSLLGLNKFRTALFFDTINRLMYFRLKSTDAPVYITDFVGI